MKNDKVMDSLLEAVSDIRDGSTLIVGGFKLVRYHLRNQSKHCVTWEQKI